MKAAARKVVRPVICRFVRWMMNWLSAEGRTGIPTGAKSTPVGGWLIHFWDAIAVNPAMSRRYWME
jgi:hypothetical protein